MKSNILLLLHLVALTCGGVAQPAISRSAQPLAAPTLAADAQQPMYAGTTKPYCNIVAGSGKTSYISSVINDPTDPAATEGVHFTVTGSNAIVTAISSNSSVLSNSGINIVQNAGNCQIKLQANGVGYTKVSVKATNSEGSSSTYTIQLAASAAAVTPASTWFQTGTADASAICSIDSGYCFVADDENNLLRLYHQQHSGQPLYSFDITSIVGATEECDLEASGTSVRYNTGRRLYWMGSMGNSKSGNLKPDRNIVLATDLNGTAYNSTLSVRSYSKNFRSSLIDWGNTQGWNFSAAAAAGMVPKRIDGFNIEGLTIAYGGDTAYVGFRAPLVPRKAIPPTAANRRYAILAPVNNFERMFTGNGAISTTPQIGEPILFDLHGLGIRSIEQAGNGGYFIVAGFFTGGGRPAVYYWDGVVPPNSGTTVIDEQSPFSTLIRLQLPNLDQLAQVSADGVAEGHPEALSVASNNDSFQITLVCDNGTVDYYNDGTEAKSLSKNEFKKFRTDAFTVAKDKLQQRAIVYLCPQNRQTVLTAVNASNYQWQVDTCSDGSCFTNIQNDAHFTGANARQLFITAIPDQWTEYQFRCMADGVPGDTISVHFALSWTGAVNTSWEQPGNWDCETIPTAFTNVIINDGTVDLHNNATVRSIKTTRASVNILGGAALRVLH